jgi:putative ATP-binding cassette transporter
VTFAEAHNLFGMRFVRHLVRLTRRYWRSPDAKFGYALLFTAILLELATVYGYVLLSGAQREIFDGFQHRDMAGFTRAIGSFLLVTGGFVVVAAYRIYARQSLEIRWRRWLTAHYLERWMAAQPSCQMELHRRTTDNPDQRITEDVRDYVASALGLSLSLISAFVTLVSFAGILWSLSGDWSFEAGGATYRIPGLMMWVAILYAVIATALTHRVGRSLVPIQYDRQRFEADFRYSLVRFRENVETIALSNGEEGERRGALQRFDRVVANYWQLIRRQRNLTLVTTSIGQTNSIVPYVIAAPFYFADKLTLGSVVQANIAYGQVSGSLVWFVNAYNEIANWRASVERLVTFDEELDAVRAERAPAEGIVIVHEPRGDLRLDNVRLLRPNGEVLIQETDASIARGDSVALVGPSGAGKRTLLRAIAGVWRFGSGRIEVPDDEHASFLSQLPYLPIGSLREAVTYPAPGDAFDDAAIRDALVAVGLPSLAGRLDEHANWEQVISQGEQQRLAFARVLLDAPDWIFLDDAASALDEDSERALYELVRERLPGITIVSVATRPGVVALHRRRWTLSPDPKGSLLEAA